MQGASQQKSPVCWHVYRLSTQACKHTRQLMEKRLLPYFLAHGLFGTAGRPDLGPCGELREDGLLISHDDSQARTRVARILHQGGHVRSCEVGDVL